MKKVLKITYQIAMLIFSPFTFGMAIPLVVMIFLNKFIYGEFPKSSNFDIYSNIVCNSASLIFLIIGYIISWFLIKNFFEKRGIYIM